MALDISRLQWLRNVLNIPGITLAGSGPYSVLEAESADAFIRALSPLDGFGRNLPLGSIIYRGQTRSDWQLIPSAFREEIVENVLSEQDKGTWKERLYSEVTTLQRFVDLTYKHGIYVPDQVTVMERLAQFARGFADEDKSEFDQWPDGRIFPVMALAQHFGLPTSLLDFTWNPYIAAYFAAYKIKTAGPGTSQSLSVWVVYDAAAALAFQTFRKLTLVSPPSFGNSHLQAQEGVFLWAPIPGGLNWTCRLPFVATPMENTLTLASANCRVVKLTLAHSQALPLLQNLLRMGVSGARVFPGVAGVVASLEELRRTGHARVLH